MHGELFRASINPLGSAVSISGDLLADSPEEEIGPYRLWASREQLIIGTLVDADGPTTFVVSFDLPKIELDCVFDGSLEVSDQHKVEIADGFLEVTYLLLRTSHDRLDVAAFTNHPTEPDYVHIQLKTPVTVDQSWQLQH